MAMSVQKLASAFKEVFSVSYIDANRKRVSENCFKWPAWILSELNLKNMAHASLTGTRGNSTFEIHETIYWIQQSAEDVDEWKLVPWSPATRSVFQPWGMHWWEKEEIMILHPPPVFHTLPCIAVNSHASLVSERSDEQEGNAGTITWSWHSWVTWYRSVAQGRHGMIKHGPQHCLLSPCELASFSTSVFWC